MLVAPGQFEELFDGALREDLASSEDKKLLVFVSTGEADSVCATRILQTICRAHSVYFTIYPVSNYGEMQDVARQEFTDAEAERTVMLVNCGACEDVRAMLELPEAVRVIVIDAHRPIHHSYNDDADTDTLFLHDATDGTAAEDIPPASDSESSSDSDSDEDSDSVHERPAQRLRTADGTAVVPAPALSRRAQRKAERAARQQARIDYYERGTYWGKPASGILYGLAHAMHLDDNRLLWLYIVGVTDQLVHQHISKDRYLQTSQVLETEVANHADVDVEEETVVTDSVSGQSTTIRLPKHFQIKPAQELRLGLLRHWSLAEALANSPYVAVRLLTWLDRGRDQLQDLLVVCGLPLAQARLAYSNMAPKFRRVLADKLAQHAPMFGLSEVAFPSFELQNGWNRATYLSASDVVAALTALLEQPVGPRDDASARDRFWRAWESLGQRDGGTLRAGLELAKKLQRAIVQDGGMMIQRKMFANFRNHRVFNLSEADIVHRDLIAQPLALQKLAAFLHDAHFQDKKRDKPVVIIGPKDAAGRCLAVGFSGNPRSGTGSKFGMAFERAARATNATARHDMFDSSIIEIGVSDIRRFTNEVTQICRLSVVT